MCQGLRIDEMSFNESNEKMDIRGTFASVLTKLMSMKKEFDDEFPEIGLGTFAQKA